MNDKSSRKKKTKNIKKGKTNYGFLKKYKWWFIGLFVILFILYIIIYCFFLASGSLPIGKELERKDWLMFFGAYLSFAGTIVVSIVSLLLNKFYIELDKERTKEKRKKELQPIFSVNFVLNSQIKGTAEAFNIDDPNSFPHHKNVTMKIENVGEYPICNVMIFQHYLCQLLKPNDKQTIQVAYSDSTDAQRWSSKIIVLSESEFERTEAGIPTWFIVNYEDIDGNKMYQYFVLKQDFGTEYYSLEAIDDA